MDDSANFLLMIGMIVNAHLCTKILMSLYIFLANGKWFHYSFNIETDFHRYL